jgi:single-stranded DNA-binding protein
MSHYNNAMLIGHASRYEFGKTASESTYCTFKLFVVDKLGQKEKKNYFNITCYNQLAELIKRFQEDNKHLLVEGRLNPWKDDEGNERFDIVASQIKFL